MDIGTRIYNNNNNKKIEKLEEEIREIAGLKKNIARINELEQHWNWSIDPRAASSNNKVDQSEKANM